MIVECSNCDTRFQLDDARVPLRGIRVRCSRCKEAFFLEHPDASKADALEDVAMQAAAGAPPESTQDLPPAASIRRAVAAEPDEEDWEFGEDFPSDDAEEEGESDFDADGLVADTDADVAGSDAEADLASQEEAPEELGVDGISMDDEDDLVSGLDLAGDDDSEVSSSAGDDDSELSSSADDDEDDGESVFGKAGDFSARADEEPDAAVAEPVPAQAAAQDIGEPEDWDFFSDEGGEQSGPGAMDDAMGRVMQAVEDPSRLERPASSPQLGHVPSGRGPRLAGLQGFGRGLGWIATCCLLGLGVARGVFDASPAALAITSTDFGALEAQAVRGAWLETTRFTRLYAVTGHLVNGSAAPRMAGDSLRAVLLASDGSRLELPPARAGLPIPAAKLRELSQNDLRWVRSHAVDELGSLRLEPGQAVAFQAVFEAVPDSATGFILEIDAAPRRRYAR